MKPLLFAPALLCLGTAVVAIGPEDDRVAADAHPVISPEARIRALPVPGDAVPVVQRNGPPRLEDVRKHLEALARDLEETQKAVEEVGRQRDAAVEEARAAKVSAQRHLQNHQRAMSHLGELQGELGAARKERSAWREKAEAGAMTHEELLAFRGELAGTRKQFDLLLGDLSKARSELQDPIERASLKKEMKKANDAGVMLRAEVEEALRAKSETEDTARRMQAELESKLEVLRSKVKEGAEWKSTLETRTGELEAEQARLKHLTADYNGLKSEHGKAASELAETMEELRKVRLASRKAGDEAAARVKEAVGRAGKSREERNRIVGERDALKSQLAEKSSEAARLRQSAEDAAQKLQSAEEARRKVTSELDQARTALAEKEKEMALAVKAKSGLEELLFRKTAELRTLRAELRKAQNGGGKGGEDGGKSNLSLHDAPRAVVVAEG